jgi:DNA-directed RNA polymerase subunit beta'
MRRSGAAGCAETVIFADKLMYMGFSMATRAGLSIAVNDMLVPEQKDHLIAEAEKEVQEIEKQYTSGLVTQGERLQQGRRYLGPCGRPRGESHDGAVVDRAGHGLGRQDRSAHRAQGQERASPVMQESLNSIYMMADSGARGSAAQIRQLAGMRGLMAKPDGSIIETPITANFREGLNVLQYFISTHGARKRFGGHALKTANSGYLTRRLVDVTQDLVVTEDDCGTTQGVSMKALIEGGEVVESLRERILGAWLRRTFTVRKAAKHCSRRTGFSMRTRSTRSKRQGIDEVKVRTPLSCETRHGLCARCYGRDLGRGHTGECRRGGRRDRRAVDRANPVRS